MLNIGKLVKTKKMKTSEPKQTKEEILEKHTKDSQWYAPVCDARILKAMQEYAEAYHKEKLRREQLEQAEAETEIAEIKSTPIPSGWICPRCQKVHSWLDMTCDCEPKTIISTTIIAADRNCNNCKNWYKSGDKSPCNNCINYNNWA